ncbi:MAG TPA: hypothetical protein PLP42_20550 [Acidobacteriota bacterium]|nr:hypothetical protein [Acidobacteriota bacterium]
MAEVLPSPEFSAVDLNSLKREISQEAAGLRSSGRPLFPDEAPNTTRAAVAQHPAAFQAQSIRSMTALADSFADPAPHVPPMHRFRGPFRRLARLAARAVILATRFMTDRQRNFNGLTTQTLSQLTDSVEQSITDLTEQVRTLQELSRRQAQRIESLEETLRAVSASDGERPTDTSAGRRG